MQIALKVVTNITWYTADGYSLVKGSAVFKSVGKMWRLRLDVTALRNERRT